MSTLFRQLSTPSARRLAAVAFVGVASCVLAACSGSSSASDASVDGSAAHSVSAPNGYPSKPVTLIVPAAAGGGADRQARVFAQGLSQQIGKPVVVQDQPGGNTAVGTQAMLAQPSDGYTVMWSISNELTYNIVTKALPVGLSGLAPVAQLAGEPTAVIAPRGKFKTFADFVRYAKANPGNVTIAGTNATGGQATMGKKLIEKLGIRARYVPYSGSPDIIAALLGGKVTIGLSGISNVIPQIKAGSIDYLAVDSPSRVSALPKVPTLKELGADPGTSAVSFFWRGLVVKAGTAPAIVQYLSKASSRVVDSYADWKSYSATNDQVAGYEGPADFTKSLKAAITEWKMVGTS